MSTFKHLQARELTYISSTNPIRASISSSLNDLQRLIIEKLLEGHMGCVNTVHFDPTGELLLSGSDDLQIIIWDWSAGSKRFEFEPGHRNNIFQVRILPHTSCKTIVSCAADGQVRVSHMGEGGSVTKRKLSQHAGRAHKLALLPDQPLSFFSCGEDGDVRFFDLREDHQNPQSGFKMPVLSGLPGDRGWRGAVDLNAVHVNPARPWLFAVGGDDQYARVYDIRVVRKNLFESSSVTSDTSQETGSITIRDHSRSSSSKVQCEPVARLCPDHMKGSTHGNRQITCVMYSRYGELLVSYHNEDMYLFEPWNGQQQEPGGMKRGRLDDDGEERHAGMMKGEDALGSTEGLASYMPDDLNAHPVSDKDKAGDCSWASLRQAGDASTSSYSGDTSQGGLGQVLMQYSGHRNIQTVKGCNFYGSCDNYVVSGSDCGHVFVWNKADGGLKQMMHGDLHVVNCLEPHPWQPLVLATSGIANSIKIWSPCGEVQRPDTEKIKEVTEKNRQHLKNRERHARRMLTITPAMMLQLLAARSGALRRQRDESPEEVSNSGAALAENRTGDENPATSRRRRDRSDEPEAEASQLELLRQLWSRPDETQEDEDEDEEGEEEDEEEIPSWAVRDVSTSESADEESDGTEEEESEQFLSVLEDD
ncbi:hypothetical protein CEUSTIGMA_g1546.t1 [Chlamydomonas eustigma]|uniref:Uncharacterized protein n=1 Tax=Chlamydomonas eustigma TaxID=1157962 RepID=A0A250WTD8_9CHLO|nr:hypothetical protein CEUSTIGMA_g1546.t1 [Chlamydomonas eustigma]|eukprot:GAX74097.1 hypothetical protein CEUSTIGMA_g1546.t1 [Chlamydomonas eustigma]